MKVIFLDIDGVLNVHYPHRDEFGRIFHPAFVHNLRFIIEHTGSKIVITSTWRFNGLDEMKAMWKHRSLPGEVLDITPFTAQLTPKKGDFYERKERGHEIQEWLDNHPEVTNYVILDDDNDMLEAQQNHFIRCFNPDHEDCEDVGYGLTKICTEKAIQILNG